MKTHKAALLVSALLLALHGGCERLSFPSRASPISPGGDSPVTTDRLAGTRLTDIATDLTWVFDASTVVVENGEQLLPPDLVVELLGAGFTPRQIEARWRLDGPSGRLVLTEARADGQPLPGELSLPIAPAGHVRVNLGTRQYNVFRTPARMP